MVPNWVSVSISCFALLISISSLYYTRSKFLSDSLHQKEDLKHKKEKDKETFIVSLKDDLNSLRKDLVEIFVSKETINYIKRDDFTFYLYKQSNDIKKYLSEDNYEKWLTLTLEIDDALNLVIYKHDHSSISDVLIKIRNFIKLI